MNIMFNFSTDKNIQKNHVNPSLLRIQELEVIVNEFGSRNGINHENGLENHDDEEDNEIATNGFHDNAD